MDTYFKSYITRLLIAERNKQQDLALSIPAMNISERAANDTTDMIMRHIDAIDEAIELINKS